MMSVKQRGELLLSVVIPIYNEQATLAELYRRLTRVLSHNLAELAYEIVGLSPDSAHIDTLGCIGDNAEVFFAYLRVPDLVIDRSA